ncbi:hypothetical protein [Psychrobacter sp. FDAARGOS_221]|uniref:hypothetical protein n=1 Tax=Psychrobacter sp. FDAARGOS_221 TaxID=1975705 RepID=UPI000BB54F77|nr:hypothetical protein [Psychrobacter sp. FDAARGOS_221]PNK59733.1 hypothetical protein A6J60_001780 [Psychrobacter sp. FDAARGOS_221]
MINSNQTAQSASKPASNNRLAHPVTQPESAVSESVASEIQAMAVQQRQILALMGVDVWVSQQRQVQAVDYDQYVQLHTQLRDAKQSNQVVTGLPQINQQAELATEHASSQSQNGLSHTMGSDQTQNTEQAPVNRTLDSGLQDQQTPEQIVERLTSMTDVTEVADDSADIDELVQTPSVPVAPFEVVAAHYHGWVLLVDTSAFNDERCFNLWQNILQALSLTPDVQNFPICAEISDQENANACLAGFIFRVAQSIDVNVVALTPMPEGTMHDKVVRAPYLTEMLADGKCKKQLWDMIAPKLV